MQDEPIRITREDLYTAEVERDLELSRRLRERQVLPPVADSGWRRLIHDSLFHLTLAGLLGAFLSWMILEPYLHDFSGVSGEVTLVNPEPFGVGVPGSLSLTVGKHEVLLIPGITRSEAGADGEPALEGPEAFKSGMFVESVGSFRDPTTLIALAVRPAPAGTPTTVAGGLDDRKNAAGFLLFPLTASLVALCLFMAEGLSSRNWRRTIVRSLTGTGLAVVFSLLSFIPAGAIMLIGEQIMETQTAGRTFITVHDLSLPAFAGFVSCRSAAWLCVALAMGLGMNLVRSTRTQLKNTVLGGMMGGALGGAFFDPVSRFLQGGSLFQGADLSRAVGLAAVGLSIGFFVALSERLTREAWVKVRTGPLAGKSFVLYRTPILVGSSPKADIYLFKDAGIAPEHAALHRVGDAWELEDLGSPGGTTASGRPVRRWRLRSGEQLCVGSTVLEFEERLRKAPENQ
ncbi:MAG: FHA domain-containing protein [Acidobacteria bacterium]|nr:FHA domain-containing protein [Acidobacteriota bacterium]